MPQTFIVVQQPDGSLKNVEAFNFLDANFLSRLCGGER